MRFTSVELTPEGRLTVQAEGHATEVMTEFHKLGAMLFGQRGAWRLVEAAGRISDNEPYESNMKWNLYAKLKGIDNDQHSTSDSEPS